MYFTPFIEKFPASLRPLSTTVRNVRTDGIPSGKANAGDEQNENDLVHTLSCLQGRPFQRSGCAQSALATRCGFAVILRWPSRLFWQTHRPRQKSKSR